MSRQFLRSITIESGQIVGGQFDNILPSDLPDSGVTPGTYANPVLAIDQYGRITSVVSGGGATGTVTSIDVSGGTTGLTFSGGPVTSSGTITMAGTLAVANGGTGAGNASGARTNLGLVIGTNVQAWDADLDTLAGLTATTDNFIVSVSSAWASRTPAQVRTTLGLVIGTNVQAWDADLDVLAGITIAANTFPARSSSGAAAAKTITDFGLSLVDDADATAGRSTLGLGTMATQNANAVAITGGTAVFNATTGLKVVSSAGGGNVSLAFVGSALTADRVFGVSVPDGNTQITFNGSYILTIAANATVSGTNTGDQTITLTGDVSGSGTGSFAATIANDAVTYAKMQNVAATNRFLGRITAGAGDPEELTAANGWTILGVMPAANHPALTGDVTNSAGSLATTVVAASDTVAGKIEVADQSEQETGTDVVRAVTPGRQQFHPSACKAFVYFTVSGTTVTVQRSYNVSSVVRNSTGNYTVNFTTAFSDALYAVAITNGVNTAGTQMLIARDNQTRAAGSFPVTFVQVASLGTLDEPARVSMSFFGDQ